MDEQLVDDLSERLCDQLIDTTNRMMDIIERADEQLSVGVSACASALLYLLHAAEISGSPPEVVAAFREHIANAILRGSGPSVIIDRNGNKVPAET